MVIELEGAGLMGPDRDLRYRDRRVGGHIDRQPGQLPALVEAEGRLPGALHVDRLGDPIAARTDPIESVDVGGTVLALPAGRVEPVGAVRRARRVELDGARGTPAVGRVPDGPVEGGADPGPRVH